VVSKFCSVLLLLCSSVFAQAVGSSYGTNPIGMICFGTGTINGFVSCLSATWPTNATIAYSIESVGFPVDVPSPFSALDELYVDPNHLIEIKPAFIGGSGVEWQCIRNIPNDPSLVGTQVVTQLLFLASPDWRLSNGWIYSIS